MPMLIITGCPIYLALCYAQKIIFQGHLFRRQYVSFGRVLDSLPDIWVIRKKGSADGRWKCNISGVLPLNTLQTCTCVFLLFACSLLVHRWDRNKCYHPDSGEPWETATTERWFHDPQILPIRDIAVGSRIFSYTRWQKRLGHTEK